VRSSVILALYIHDRRYCLDCVHVLWSTYHPSYSSLIRHSYTSDAFPLTETRNSDAFVPLSSSSGTTVVDLLIVLNVMSRQRSPRSILDSRRPSWDLFDLMRPRASRVRPRRLSRSVVSRPHRRQLLFCSRHVGVVCPSRRMIVDVERTKDDNNRGGCANASPKVQGEFGGDAVMSP
jgi:hypothetical protein